MKKLLTVAASLAAAVMAFAQDATTVPAREEMTGDFIIINSQVYNDVEGISDMRPMTITDRGDSLVISNMYMRGCLDVKADYDEENGNLTIPSGVLIYHIENIVYYLYQWNDDQEMVNPRPITYKYAGNGEWRTDATLMLMVGYEEGDLQPSYFAQGSEIVKANGTAENVSFAASGLDRYDESRPCLVRIDDLVITIYNFLQADQFGYGCMAQGVIDNSRSNAIFVTSVVGQANDGTYRILAGCELNEDGNLPTGISHAGERHEGYTYAAIDLENGTIDFEPMAIWAGIYDSTTGSLDIDPNSVFETVATARVTYDPSRTTASSVTETVADGAGSAEAVRTDYYRIDGTMTDQPRDGELVIKRTQYKDGSAKSEKMIWRD